MTEGNWPDDVRTLCVDIGGSGFKAAIVDSKGEMTTDRRRVDTPYPCDPSVFVQSVSELVRPLTGAHRASVGFPGLIRYGRVVEVPSLSRREYGGRRDPTLAAAWRNFEITGALAQEFAIPTKVANDADVQGCAVVSGTGVEFVMTLGTGLGTALFEDGTLLPHLELSHLPYNDQMSFDIALGNGERKAIGKKRWVKRVRRAIGYFDDALYFDRLYVGGGNALHLTPQDLGDKGHVVPNTSGILGGVRVWTLDRH